MQGVAGLARTQCVLRDAGLCVAKQHRRAVIPVDADEHRERVRNEGAQARGIIQRLVKGKEESSSFKFKTKGPTVTTVEKGLRWKQRIEEARARNSHIDPSADRQHREELNMPSLLQLGNNLASPTGSYAWAILNDIYPINSAHTSVRNASLWNHTALYKDPACVPGTIIELRYGPQKVLKGYGLFMAKTTNKDAYVIDILVVTEEEMKIDALFWNNRIRLAMQRRTELVDLRMTTGYRLINGTHDRLPGVYVDILGDIAYVKFFPEAAPILPSLMVFLADDMQIPHIHCRDCIMKTETWLDADPFKGQNRIFPSFSCKDPVYKENDVQLLTCHPSQKFEHPGGRHWMVSRSSRALIKSLSNGKTVLDLFCGTGGFAAHALAGGASFVTAVDNTPLYTYATMQNLMLNDPKERCNYSVRLSDSGKFYGDARSAAQAVQSGEADRRGKSQETTRAHGGSRVGANTAAEPLEYDVVICDLPIRDVLQNRNESMMQDGAPDITNVTPFVKELMQAMYMVKDGGFLLMSLYLDRMNNEVAKFTVEKAARKAGRRAQIVRLLSPSADFPELLSHTRDLTRRYKGFLVRILGPQEQVYVPMSDEHARRKRTLARREEKASASSA